MGAFSKKFDPNDLSDLAGKVAIVTDGNIGLGYSTVKHLTRRGARVRPSRVRGKAPADGFLVGVHGLAIRGKHHSGLGKIRE
jgi:NAD(P)-dependent dehydrogenase (short-subunit alcohol dehydrogenase family)